MAASTHVARGGNAGGQGFRRTSYAAPSSRPNGSTEPCDEATPVAKETYTLVGLFPRKFVDSGAQDGREGLALSVASREDGMDSANGEGACPRATAAKIRSTVSSDSFAAMSSYGTEEC
jgi:hypothetical protein